MIDKNTSRTFTALGGGNRGYLSNRILKNIIRQSGLTYQEFFALQDVMAGTSVGGIMVMAFSSGKSPEDMDNFFLTSAPRIFTSRTALEFSNLSHNASLNSNILSSTQKAALLAEGIPFYQSPYPDSDFGHNILYQLIDSTFGIKKMSSLQNKVIIPATRLDNTQYILFSNIKDDSFFTCNDELIADVAKSTSAAPTYLPSHTFGGKTLGDGGTWCNNASLICSMAAKAINPAASTQISCTIGTGTSYWGFRDTDTVGSATYGINQVLGILDEAMWGSQLYSSLLMKYASDRLVTTPNKKHFEFDAACSFELDNSTLESTLAMNDIADAYCMQQSDNIAAYIGHLLA